MLQQGVNRPLRGGTAQGGSLHQCASTRGGGVHPQCHRGKSAGCARGQSVGIPRVQRPYRLHGLKLLVLVSSGAGNQYCCAWLGPAEPWPGRPGEPAGRHRLAQLELREHLSKRCVHPPRLAAQARKFATDLRQVKPPHMQILMSVAEHHSSLAPWQQVSRACSAGINARQRISGRMLSRQDTLSQVR